MLAPRYATAFCAPLTPFGFIFFISEAFADEMGFQRSVGFF
jgi:hypothetical protein